ncbi:MAG: glutamate racemase [Rikenellaceae bacterium]
MNNQPIGIFDSGFGGLTIFRAISELLPEESLIYLGDGANCPYGLRSNSDIEQLADSAVERLVAMGCKMIVVACNTATAAAIEFLRAKYTAGQGIQIVGMEPAVKPACLATQSGVVGVLATQRSLEGDLFQRTAAKYSDSIKIVASFGAGFVEVVESDMEDSPEAEAVVRKVVEPMVEQGVDQIVLGCTHYPFLIPILRRIAPQVNIVDPSPAVARRVAQLLEESDMKAVVGSVAEYEFTTFADEDYRNKLRKKALKKC